ncbi:MAG TPA: phosphomannomutase/phosphoglucomutase [Thermodesulfobacteriota bacterium]|nr:phosphomannomutase/phosphoglucomutase [Thermodesulfobacteriota bacterium]
MQISPHIFREYDIRGIVGKDIDEDVVERIGKAYGTYVRKAGKKRVSLGRDCRHSSPAFAEAMTRGINSTGVDVVDIGMVSTPMVYFCLFNMDVEGGVMVTASHNPAEYNGLKLCVGKESLFGDQIQQIRKIAEGGDFASGTGSVETRNIMDDYLRFLKENLDIKPGVRVAIDCGNGMVGIVAPKILDEFGCEVTELYVTPDGTFPNHHPDPTVEENIKELIDTVKREKLQLGIGFDGDGDRIGVVDENGNIIWGDMLLLIFARDILKQIPGATVIGDVKSSTRLFREIEKLGGKAIMWKTGHSLIKNKLKVEGAALGGEMSGHMFFGNRFFGYDDALYAALRLLEIISKTGKKVSELLANVPPAFSTPEIRVECPDEIKFQVVEKVKEELSNEYRVIDVDGARIEFPDGWGLIRASNTQPALVLRFEALTKERLQEIRSLIERELEQVKSRFQSQ